MQRTRYVAPIKKGYQPCWQSTITSPAKCPTASKPPASDWVWCVCSKMQNDSTKPERCFTHLKALDRASRNGILQGRNASVRRGPPGSTLRNAVPAFVHCVNECVNVAKLRWCLDTDPGRQGPSLDRTSLFGVVPRMKAWHRRSPLISESKTETSLPFKTLFWRFHGILAIATRPSTSSMRFMERLTILNSVRLPFWQAKRRLDSNCL